MTGTLPMEEIEMFLNKYDKPATMADRNTRHITMKNPLDGLKYSGNVSADALKELEIVLKAFRASDAGENKGPYGIDSRFFFTIAFESFAQREAFRKALSLTRHGEQYWTGKAFMGSLELLKEKKGTSLSEYKRENPFAKREAPVAAKAEPTNAEKYSKLRAEVKRTQEKMQGYTEDRTWIAVCFPSEKDMEAARKKLALPEGKFIHVEDVCNAVEKKFGISLDVPVVPFGLRAVAKPDKALLALVEDY